MAHDNEVHITLRLEGKTDAGSAIYREEYKTARDAKIPRRIFYLREEPFKMLGGPDRIVVAITPHPDAVSEFSGSLLRRSSPRVVTTVIGVDPDSVAAAQRPTGGP